MNPKFALLVKTKGETLCVLCPSDSEIARVKAAWLRTDAKAKFEVLNVMNSQMWEWKHHDIPWPK